MSAPPVTLAAARFARSQPARLQAGRGRGWASGVLARSLLAVALGACPPGATVQGQPAPGATSAAAGLEGTAVVLLRDGGVVRGKVAELSVDGVRLERWIDWGRVEAGFVSQRQAEFDSLLGKYGDPFFRLRARLKTGDDWMLEAPAQALLPAVGERSSGAAYLTWQAWMWSCLARGRREDAVAAYLRCRTLLQDDPSVAEALPTTRRLRHDSQLGLADALSPMFFDKGRAAAAAAAIEGRPEADASAGARLYLAALEIAAERPLRAEPLLAELAEHPDPRIRDWRALLKCRILVEQGRTGEAAGVLRGVASNAPGATRGWAWYWLGRATWEQAQDVAARQEAQLWCARAAALHPQEAELVAASLFQLARMRSDVAGETLLEELRRDYAHTHFGQYALRMQADAR